MNPGREKQALTAGRSLDALVAEKVMGWGLADDGAVIIAGAHLPCPSFSEDIAAAWEVVEKLCPTANKTEPWMSLITNGGRWECDFHRGAQMLQAFADTAPHAICLAALKAVGVDSA